MREVHGWRRVLRWVQMFFAIVLSLVMLVIIAATLVLHTRWGRELVRSQIQARLDSTFIGGATLGGVHGNPMSELVLDDLVINGPDKQPAIRVKRLRIKLPLLPLLSHQLRIDRLIADDLDVILRNDPAGGSEIEHLTKPGPPSTWNIALPDVRVHRGHIAVDTGKEMVDLDGLELWASSTLPFGGPIDASASLRATWRQRKAPITVGAVVHAGTEAIEVRSALVAVGDVAIAATGARIPRGDAPKAFGGTVAVRAPARAVAQLAPQVKLPADVSVAINAVPAGRFTDLAIAGSVGGAPVRGFGRGDVGAQAGRGFVTAADLDLGALSKGALDGPGGALVAFDVTRGSGALPDARAIVQTWGIAPQVSRANALIALDTHGTKIRATVGAATATGIRAGIGAEVTRDGSALTLDRGILVAATLDPARASDGKAPLHGALDADLRAHGALSPSPDLTIAGHVDGRRLSFSNISAGALHAQIDARQLPRRPVGTARVTLTNIKRQDIELRDLIVAAGNRPDGKIQVTVRTDPEPAPWRFDLDALITPGSTIGIDLQRHIVRAAGGTEWHGTTGHIAISRAKIEVRDLKSESCSSYLVLDATLGRKTGALDAKLDASVDLNQLSSKVHGTVDAHVAVDRRGGRFGGSVTADAHGVSLDPKSALTLDGSAKITASEGTLTAAIGASSAHVGSARLEIAVDGPRDMANAKAWKTLTRSAVKDFRVQLSHLDVAAIGKLMNSSRQMMGQVDGDIHITPDIAIGNVALRGLRGSLRDLGVIDADLEVAQTAPDELSTTAQARLGDLGKIDMVAKVATPAKLFDPAAWKKLGPAAIRGATVRSDQIPFDPGTLERFGLVTQFRGVASIDADIAPGLTGASVALDLHNFRGGTIVAPIEVHVDTVLDNQAVTAIGTVRASGVTLLSLSSKIPVTVTQLRADPDALKQAPLTATATIPSIPAKALLVVLGNTQIAQGTLDGKIEVGGTVGKPTAKLAVTAHDVAVPFEGTRATRAIHELKIDGSWDGDTANLDINGDDTAGGTLKVDALARRDDLENAHVTIKANHMDLAPIAPFLPGPAGGLGGQLDASFALQGLDPRTAQLAGTVQLSDGRLPIAPVVGTLLHGDLRIEVKDQKVSLRLSGKLGKGDVQMTADAPLEGITPNGGQAKLTLRKVKLIGTTEPVIDSSVDAHLARVDGRWTADVTVEKAKVVIPEQGGQALHPVGAPPDLVFKGDGRHIQPPAEVQVEGGQPRRRPPEEPMLVATITVKNARVESKEVRGDVTGKLTVSLDNREIGIVGNIRLGRGDLDLFDRRYVIDRAALNFDGSTDPLLDVRITHDFPDVTTVTEVHGRMSKPELVMSSQPPTYSQAELLGFLLGGEPNSDPNLAPSARQKVETAGTSFVTSQVSGYVRRALPVDIDVLRYESATASSSAAVLVGTWITRSLFLAYRQHLEARPDENTGEGELEYWIRRRLVLQGTVGDRGYHGIDLLWRRRW
jgi:translocation and assembly module TamB